MQPISHKDATNYAFVGFLKQQPPAVLHGNETTSLAWPNKLQRLEIIHTPEV